MSKQAKVTFKKCPFCSGAIIAKYEGIRDRFDTTTETFNISECTVCQAAFINPMPVGDASQYYPTNYLSSEADDAEESSKFDFEKWYRYNQYNYDFNLLKRAGGPSVAETESYVDIGCGSGERVTYALEKGCQKPYGVDKFDFAKSKSKQEITIINSEVLDYKPKQKLQVASLFHVLEHIENPDEMLQHIRKSILRKDGYLVVQVPNYGSFERRVFGRKWFSFDVPRHLWQFNQKALTDMLIKAGYKIDGIYQSNAPLHPVTIVPSLHRELDIQRIWVNRTHGNWYKKVMTLVWAGLTILTIPLTVLQNIFNRSSMLTVIASPK
jgi:SAM-dependent methyltransferase